MSNTAGTPNKDGQAPKLKPLEVNGITAVTIGTIAWSIALVVLLLARGWLAETGRTHWIWIAATGVVLGLLGYRYATRRVKRLGLGGKSEPDQSQLIHDFE